MMDMEEIKRMEREHARFERMEKWDEEDLNLNDDYDFEPPEGSDAELCSPLIVVSRKDWGALPARGFVPLQHPIFWVIQTYTTRRYPCYSKEECIKVVQDMQRDHMDVHGFSDIAYNFIIGRDGTVYEGRGWHARSAKNLRFNPKFYGRRLDIAFIGDFSTEFHPPIDMCEGAVNLCNYGIDNNYITEPYRIKKRRFYKERILLSHMEGKEFHMVEPRDLFYSWDLYKLKFEVSARIIKQIEDERLQAKAQAASGQVHEITQKQGIHVNENNLQTTENFAEDVTKVKQYETVIESNVKETIYSNSKDGLDYFDSASHEESGENEKKVYTVNKTERMTEIKLNQVLDYQDQEGEKRSKQNKPNMYDVTQTQRKSKMRVTQKVLDKTIDFKRQQQRVMK